MADAENTTESDAPKAPEPTPAPTVAAPVVAAPKSYEALVDLQYNERFIEAGETTNDVPAESVKWLVEQHFIREVT